MSQPATVFVQLPPPSSLNETTAQGMIRSVEKTRPVSRSTYMYGSPDCWCTYAPVAVLGDTSLKDEPSTVRKTRLPPQNPAGPAACGDRLFTKTFPSGSTPMLGSAEMAPVRKVCTPVDARARLGTAVPPTAGKITATASPARPFTTTLMRPSLAMT